MSIYLDKIRHAFTKRCLVSKHVLCSKFDLSKTFYRIRQFVFTPLFSLFFNFDNKLRMLNIIKLVNDEQIFSYKTNNKNDNNKAICDF